MLASKKLQAATNRISGAFRAIEALLFPLHRMSERPHGERRALAVFLGKVRD
jgi:hypothetical protein